ncbi:hypothetical protein Tco_1039637 [Tanacetum coccineum]
MVQALVVKKQAEVSRQEVSDSNSFDVLNAIENDDDLGDTENPFQQKEHNTNVSVSTDHTEPIVTLADGSQPAIVDSYPENGKGLNRDKNMEETIHMVHDTTSEGYEDVMTGITGVERKASMEAIEVVWKKLLADVTGTSNVPINVGTSPRIDTPIVKSVFLRSRFRMLEQ